MTDQRFRPTKVLLHVTHRCDLACRHCFQDEQTHPHAGEMSLEQIRALLQELARAGGLVLTLTGGEPFLRRDLLDIVAEARRLRFAVVLKTAGQHMDRARAERLAALHVQDVQVSLYSHDPAVADAFTQRRGSWERAVRTLTLLREAGVRTSVRACMTSFNQGALRELRELGERLGAPVTLDPAVNVRTSGDAAPLDLALAAQDRAGALVSIGLRYRASADESCDGSRGFAHPDTPMCGAARNTVSISAQGELHACQLHPVPAGNALRDGFQSVWEHSPVFQELRGITYGELAKTGCSGCGYQSVCHPCMALAVTEAGSNRACNTSSFVTAQATELVRRRGLPAPATGWGPLPPPPPTLRRSPALLRILGQP